MFTKTPFAAAALMLAAGAAFAAGEPVPFVADGEPTGCCLPFPDDRATSR